VPRGRGQEGLRDFDGGEELRHRDGISRCQAGQRGRPGMVENGDSVGEEMELIGRAHMSAAWKREHAAAQKAQSKEESIFSRRGHGYTGLLGQLAKQWLGRGCGGLGQKQRENSKHI
jgi:hypothetical protein